MQLNVRYKLTVSITNYFVIIIFEIYVYVLLWADVCVSFTIAVNIFQ